MCHTLSGNELDRITYRDVWRKFIWNKNTACVLKLTLCQRTIENDLK